MKLYELTEQYQSFLDYISSDEIEIDEQTILDTLESIEGAIDDKVSNLSLVIKALKGEYDVVKRERNRLQSKESALTKKIDSLKEYMLSNMEKVGRQKIKTPLSTVWIQESRLAVKEVDEETIDKKYKIPQPDSINRDLILKDTNKGIVVKGVEIGRSRFIRIR